MSDTVMCDSCKRKVFPIDCKEDDDEDQATCDTCGGMATEVPGLGFVCVRHGLPLIEINDHHLYHPETISAWKRFKLAALFTVLLLLPLSAHAATYWTEDWEHETSEILSPGHWPSSSNNPGCVGLWPTSGALTVSTDRAYSGSHSLKFHQTGHQQAHITAGQTTGALGTKTNVECTATRRYPASTEVWYTYYEYFDKAFIVDEIGTKGIGNGGSPVRMGWATIYKWGDRSQLAFSCERCIPATGGTREYYPNMNGGWTMPLANWVCYEQHFKMNSPGSSNAVYEAYATNMSTKSATKQFAGYYNQKWLSDSPTYTALLPSNNTFIGFTVYVQDGLGDRYLDLITVSNTRVGCGTGSGGATIRDTTPPDPPQGVRAAP